MLRQHPVHHVHRFGAAALGVALGVFGLLGFVHGVGFLSRGQPVMGMSANGLLAAVSLVVAATLVAAAVRGGWPASTAMLALGVLFLLSGLGNLAVLNTGLNVLAFELSNVIFSLVAGMFLLFLGAYGRLTGGLPADNPYRRAGQDPQAAGPDGTVSIPASAGGSPAVARELADAERAVAQGQASTEQTERVHSIAALRSQEQRCRAWELAGRQTR